MEKPLPTNPYTSRVADPWKNCTASPRVGKWAKLYPAKGAHSRCFADDLACQDFGGKETSRNARVCTSANPISGRGMAWPRTWTATGPGSASKQKLTNQKTHTVHARGDATLTALKHRHTKTPYTLKNTHPPLAIPASTPSATFDRTGHGP
jgi:hypothetical protein